MNNTTTKRTTVTAVVALFMAATLVVGIGTLATTTSTAFAYQQKNKIIAAAEIVRMATQLPSKHVRIEVLQVDLILQ